MSNWRPQHYKSEAKSAGVSDPVINAANKTASLIRSSNSRVPVILTLKHLANLSGVPYIFLRKIVSREEVDPYRSFRLKKRPLPNEPVRFRRITVPNPQLKRVQSWIASKVLAEGQVHDASVAFAPGDTLLKATTPHCEAQWLIKIDIKSFFESVTERQAYNAIRKLGYQPLIAFEIARICTRVGSTEYRSKLSKWVSKKNKWSADNGYFYPLLGHLPQGAPSSPMLANLSVIPLDSLVQSIAEKYELTYTRYADDLTLSSTNKSFTRRQSKAVIFETYKALRHFGFDPNLAKTVVSPPGSRKIVLGLLVNGPKPRLSRDFKNNLRKHLYYLEKYGPVEHTNKQKSGSIFAVKSHVKGLIAHASQIELNYAIDRYSEFNSINWP